jgi:hypothetical protein
LTGKRKKEYNGNREEDYQEYRSNNKKGRLVTGKEKEE